MSNTNAGRFAKGQLSHRVLKAIPARSFARAGRCPRQGTCLALGHQSTASCPADDAVGRHFILQAGLAKVSVFGWNAKPRAGLFTIELNVWHVLPYSVPKRFLTSPLGFRMFFTPFIFF